MKKILLTLLMVAMASSAFAIVEGSKHDMRLLTGETEIRLCAYCHTPHHANVVGDYMPLWSHETTAIVNFAEYDSDTFNGSATLTDPMVGPSLLCMSCHDGAVAPDAYYGMAGTTVPEADVWNGYGIGQFGDMSNDHPIGFDYVAAQAADGNVVGVSEIRLASDPLAATGDNYGIATVSEVLHNGTIMTCASCHDVHNGPQVVNPGQGYFLYGEQQDSQVCTMCHLK